MCQIFKSFGTTSVGEIGGAQPIIFKGCRCVIPIPDKIGADLAVLLPQLKLTKVCSLRKRKPWGESIPREKKKCLSVKPMSMCIILLTGAWPSSWPIMTARVGINP
jgi:hypothetical protein